MTDLVPKSIAEIERLAAIYASSSLVTPDEREAAAKRAHAMGVQVADAIRGDLFVRLLAGASRGLDPSTSLSYFSIYGGAVRATREAPLALVRGQVAEMDERLLTLHELQMMERISVGYPSDHPDLQDHEVLERRRYNWRAHGADDGVSAEASTLAKFHALQVRVVERLRLLEAAGRDDDAAFKAAVCAVRRRGEGAWHVRIFDLDMAAERGLCDNPENEWWQKWQDDALKYQARQPLLRTVFPDLLGNVPIDDDVRVAPASPVSSTSPGTAEAAGPPDVQEGVTRV